MLRSSDPLFYLVRRGPETGTLDSKFGFTTHDDVALVVGGSIVIPHLRRAYALLTELYS